MPLRSSSLGKAACGSFPCSNIPMKLAGWYLLTLLAFSSLLVAQNTPTPQPRNDYSGMYSFLREGEFVQITIEDEGHVSGFGCGYGDTVSDRGAFLDQFFKDGKLDGNKINFSTATAHGVWYEFKGTIDRGAGKTLADEGFYVVKGTLMEYRTDADKKVTSKSREVVFKSFPRGV